MKINVYRSIRDGGWTAENEIDLGNDLILQLRTTKRTKGVGCFASVHKRDGNFLTHRMFQDYSREIANEMGRATEKLVAHVHQKGLDTVPTILLAIRAQYGLPEITE